MQHNVALVAKLYHPGKLPPERKLVTMLTTPPDDPMAEEGRISIAWPVDLLLTVDGTQSVVGFLMPRVNGMRPLIDFYNPRTRREQCPLFDTTYLHRTARNLATAIRALHDRGYVIGDVNESNSLASETALVTLVDTDSFQVPDSHNGVVYRCFVGKPEYTPPELQGKVFANFDRAPEHDIFGLSVLIFMLLMEGTHPFGGLYLGSGEPPNLEESIAAGFFPYSLNKTVPFRPRPSAPSFDILHPTLQRLFVQCFEEGHTKPQVRPDARTWQSVLRDAEAALVSCSTNAQHHYSSHLSDCPWCERTAQLHGRDPFPSQEAVRRREHLQPLSPRKAPTPRPAPIIPPPPVQPVAPRNIWAWVAPVLAW